LATFSTFATGSLLAWRTVFARISVCHSIDNSRHTRFFEVPFCLPVFDVSSIQSWSCERNEFCLRFEFVVEL
jgi:hypothetical protein